MPDAFQLAIKIFATDSNAKSTIQSIGKEVRAAEDHLIGFGQASDKVTDKVTGGTQRAKDELSKFVKKTDEVKEGIDKIGSSNGFEKAEAGAKGYWQAVDQAAEKTENLQRSMTTIRNAAAGLAVAGGAGIMASNRFIQGAEEDMAAVARLDAMLAKRGEGGRLEEMTEWAGALAHTAALVDDDPINAAAAGLLGFGMNADEIMQIMPGLIGQSRLYGQELDGVAMAMGKAFAKGNVGALVKSGVTIDPAEVERIAAITDLGARQKAMFEAVKTSMEQYALGITEGLSESEIAANRFQLAMDSTNTAIGKGAANAKNDILGMAAGLVAVTAENPGLAEGAGYIFTYGSYLSAGVGSLVAFGSQVGLTAIGLKGMGITGVASFRAVTASAWAATVPIAIIAAKVLAVAAVVSAVFYALDKLSHWREDKQLQESIASGDVASEELLKIENEKRKKLGKSELTMEQYQGNPNADDPNDFTGASQGLKDAQMNVADMPATPQLTPEMMGAMNFPVASGGANANAFAMPDLDGDDTESAAGIRDLEDAIAGTGDKTKAKELKEQLRSAKRADADEKATTREQTAFEKSNEKLRKANEQLLARKADRESRLLVAQLEADTDLKIKQLEALKTDDNAKETDTKIASIRAAAIRKKAQIKADLDDEFGESGGIELANIEAKSLEDQAAIEKPEKEKKSKRKFQLSDSLAFLRKGGTIFDYDQEQSENGGKNAPADARESTPAPRKPVLKVGEPTYKQQSDGGWIAQFPPLRIPGSPLESALDGLSI